MPETPQPAHDDLDVTRDRSGNYLAAADVEAGPLRLQIVHVERLAFPARGDTPARSRIVVTFGTEPPTKLPLNKTNLDTVADLYGNKATAWIGKAIEAYYDPTVRNPAGKQVGGLRLRTPTAATAPRRRPTPVATPEPQPVAVDGGDDDKDVPF